MNAQENNFLHTVRPLFHFCSELLNYFFEKEKLTFIPIISFLQKEIFSIFNLFLQKKGIEKKRSKFNKHTTTYQSLIIIYYSNDKPAFLF